MDQLPRLGKRELICLLWFTCNYVVSVWRGFLFLWVLGMGYVILFWHSLSLHISILLRPVRSRYDLATTNALPRRLCYLGIASLDASAMLLLRSWRSGQIHVWFKCFPEVGVNLFNSRPTLLRISSNMFGSIFM